jgi:hypothetical protein
MLGYGGAWDWRQKAGKEVGRRSPRRVQGEEYLFTPSSLGDGFVGGAWDWPEAGKEMKKGRDGGVEEESKEEYLLLLSESFVNKIGCHFESFAILGNGFVAGAWDHVGCDWGTLGLELFEKSLCSILQTQITKET